MDDLLKLHQHEKTDGHNRDIGGKAASKGRRWFIVSLITGGVMTVLRGIFRFAPMSAAAASAPADRGAGLTTGSSFRVSVRNLVVEGGTKPGDTVKVKMTIDTAGSGTKAVPWIIYRGRKALASGIRPNVTAGASFEASAAWQALSGVHTFSGAVDPNNTLGEPTNEQRNNISQPFIATYSDWPRWINGAKEGVKIELQSWLLGASLEDVVVNGPIAAGGRVSYPGGLKEKLSGRMREYGAPQNVVDGFMGAVADAVQRWAGSIKVPSLPWYPAFAVVPSPVAPPTPNVPSPYALLQQDLSPLQQGALSAAIRGRIGEAAGWPGGNAAIEDFSRWFSTSFLAALGHMVTNVLGEGPVPTFAPPYVPVGPVAGGRARCKDFFIQFSIPWGR